MDNLITFEQARPLLLRRWHVAQAWNAIWIVAVVTLLPLTAASEDLSWDDTDWSQGRYDSVDGLDPDIQPGALGLRNLPEDMRFVSEPTQFRGVYAMASFRDTLFLGAGPTPWGSDGADILSYDYRTDSSTLAYQLYEQGVTAMHVFGDTLYIPGADNQGPHSWGNIYMYDGSWTRKETVPYGIHVVDLAVLDNAIYVTGGGGSTSTLEGAVWRSTDWGDSFEFVASLQLEGASVRRMYGAGVHQGKAYFQPDAIIPGYDWVVGYDGAVWDTVDVSLDSAKHGRFTSWGDSLTLSSGDSWHVFDGQSWNTSPLPFMPGNRWCGGVGRYGDSLYGGAGDGRFFRWRPETGWVFLGEVGLNPFDEEIEAVVQHLGRLYVSTSGTDGGFGGRLYVSAVLEEGELVSEVHDFGQPVLDGVLSWDAFVAPFLPPVSFQIRSATSLVGLATAEFQGPDGSDEAFYQVSGAMVHSSHQNDQFFQYRVRLECPGGRRMPILRSVNLSVTPTIPTSSPEEVPTEPVHLSASVSLGPPLPNPGRTTTSLALRIEGDVAPGAEVRFRVFDPAGRSVFFETLALDGRREVVWEWDLRDSRSRQVPVGMYLVSAQLSGGADTVTQSLRVLR